MDHERNLRTVQETLDVLRSDLVHLREQDISLLQMFMQMHFTLRMLQRSNRNWRRTNSLMPPSKTRPLSHRRRINIETTSDGSRCESADKDIHVASSEEVTSGTRGQHTSFIERTMKESTSDAQTTSKTHVPYMTCIERMSKDMTTASNLTSETHGSYTSYVEPTKPDEMRDRFAMPSLKQRHPMLIRIKSEPAPYGCINAEEDEEDTPNCSLDTEGEGLDRDPNSTNDSTERSNTRKNSLKLSLDFADSPTTDILDDMPSFLKRQYLNALTSHASVAKVFFQKIQNPDTDTDAESNMELKGRRLERQKAVCSYSTENSIDSD